VVVKESSIAASKQFIWAFTIIFILHNLEELLRMSEFLNDHMNEFPSFFQQAASMWQGNSFSAAIWGLNGFALLLAVVLTLNVQKRWVHVLFVFLTGIMGINAVMHIGQSIYLRNLVPGVVTAVMLVLPLSMRCIRHELDTGWVNKRLLILLLGAGLIAMPLMIWLLMMGTQWLMQI
jgi:hypothetical protein